MTKLTHFSPEFLALSKKELIYICLLLLVLKTFCHYLNLLVHPFIYYFIRALEYTACVWRSEGYFMELLLSFLHVGFGA